MQYSQNTLVGISFLILHTFVYVKNVVVVFLSRQLSGSSRSVWVTIIIINAVLECNGKVVGPAEDDVLDIVNIKAEINV